MTRLLAIGATTLALSTLALAPAAASIPVTGVHSHRSGSFDVTKVQSHRSSAAAKKPKPGPWTNQDFTFDIDKGMACNVAIRVKMRGEERYTDYSENKIGIEARHESATLTNLSNKKHTKVSLNGKFTVTLSPVDAPLLKVAFAGKGGNFVYGGGLRGIVYIKGSQKYVTDYDKDGNASTTIVSANGSLKELCTVLKAKPVVGQ